MVTDAMSALGMETSDADVMVDQMAKTASSTNTSVAQLGEGILKIGATARNVKGGTAELNTALGILANNGIKGAEGGTHLRNVILSLQEGCEDGAIAVGDMSVQVYDAEGNMRSLNDILGDMNTAMDGMTAEEKNNIISKIFNKTDLASVNALLANTGDTWDDLQNSITNSAGAAQQMADTQLDNLQGQLTLLKSALEGLAISIGEILMPYIKSIVSHIQSFVDWLNNLDERTQKIIVTVALVVAAIGPVLIIVGKVISSVGTIMTIVPKVVSLMGTVKTAMAGLNATMATNPIGLIITAIGLLVAAFIYLWNNCEGFREFWINLWEKIKEVAITVWTAIKDFFVTIWEAIKNTFTTVVNAISSFLSSAWNAIKTTVETVMNAIKTVISTIWNAIKTVFETVFNAIKTVVTTYFNIYKTIIETVLNVIKTVVTTVWNAIKTAVETVVNAIKTVITTAWNAIKTTTSTIFNAVKSVVTSVWNGIKSAVMNVVNTMKSGISNGFNAIKSTISNIVNGIKNTISNVFNTIWSTVSGIVNKLKSVFNFSWSLPKIKLPHFSITGSFSLNPPSIPHFSVDWYKKAMSGGMILKDATIFGQSGGTLLGGGEAGDEAVVGVSSLRSMIQDAVSSATLSVSGDQPLINIEEMSVRSDDDIRKISQQLNTLLTAGRRAKGLV
jgi:TP901 family phage tail tape measure protein